MIKKISIILSLIFILSPVASYAKDMRQVSIEADKEYKATIQRQKKIKTAIYKDKKKLKSEISSLRKENTSIEKRNTFLIGEIKKLREINKELQKEEEKNQAGINELTGSVRVSAKELQSILAKSVFTGFDKERPALLKPLLDKKRFPGIDDMKLISKLFFEEADLTGDVFIKNGEYINNKGETKNGEILTIGGFTSYYPEGFLHYSDRTKEFYTLSKEPSYFVKSAIKKYYNGDSDTIPADISGGGALIQLTHRQTMGEKIKKGGILIWPILAIALAAVLIAIERFIFIRRVHENTDSIMGKVNGLAEEGKWEACHKIVGEVKKIPVYNVLRAGLKARNQDRETLESVLQESILKELPRLEKFLPLLNILGAIAPLLGLLGTVTGMINTFQVITVYGTGDPRMMSGGISTALVTTMLGLSVAIPIMLLHTFLSRRVDHVIGDMEEKAVALTNIIFRDKGLS